MDDTTWVLHDLGILRGRFREARLTYPGLHSELATLPDDGRSWDVRDWEGIISFSTIREIDCDWHEMPPAVNFFFFRPAVSCLKRSLGAGWNLRDAAACFGELAMSIVATMHITEGLRALAKQFWWQKDERAWIGLLHYWKGMGGAETLRLTSCSLATDGEWEELDDEREVQISYVEDVFEASCRLIGELIQGLEDSSLQPAIDANPPAVSVIAVILHPPQVKLYDTIYRVSPDGALFVQALVAADADWTAGRSLGMRADRVKAALPEAIRALIESTPGKGYRLRREL